MTILLGELQGVAPELVQCSELQQPKGAGDKAANECGNGDSAMDDNKPDKAIKHYGKAWKHAIRAAKEAAK